MTLNQHEKQRLLQALQDDPVFLAQVRSLILSAELVQLPERFAQFATNVTAFIERQERFNAAVEDRLQRITDDLGTSRVTSRAASRATWPTTSRNTSATGSPTSWTATT